MYRIIDQQPHLDGADTLVCKAHLVTDDVVELVTEDMKRLGAEPYVTKNNWSDEELPNEAHLDYGGILQTNWRPMETDVFGCKVSFFAHHGCQLFFMLNKGLESRKLGFCRIFTDRYVFACSYEFAEELLSKMKALDSEIKARADQEYADYAAFVEASADHPNVKIDAPIDPSKADA